MCWGRPDEPDSDGDGFPDACDLCPGKTDLDRDFDNVPDGCDNITRYYNPMEPRREHVPKYRPDCECIDPPYPACCHQPESGRVWITRVEDSEGRLLESFEYTDFGEISKKTVWDGAGTPLYVTTYEFNENEQLTGHTETYPNAKTPPRTTKVFRDEEGRYIGSRVEGEDPSTIHYYDENRRRILVTTAMDPPEEEKTLERFERDAKGRILKHEKVIPETGKLEVVLTIGYIDHEDGSREVITRERINSDSERLTIEGFAKYGRRIWKKEYPTPITPRGTEPDENPLVTRYEFHSEKAPNREYPNQSEWHIRIPPSGVRQVSGWRMEGEHGKKGSLKIFESYTTTEEHPRDSDKQEWTQRTEALFEGGLYFPVEVRDPSGAVSTYRRDRDEPANVLMRREVDASGRHVETIRYEYDDEGNTIREETERDGRKRTYTTEYDDRDRVLIRGTVTDAGTMEEHTRYDSFDRIVKECVVVHSREYSMVLPNWSVSFAEADEPYVLLGHGWETLGVETDSPCKVDRANVVIRRLPRDDSEAERTETRSLSGPVFRAWVEQGGGSIDGEAKHATVTLCGGRRARIESIDITSEKQGVTETVWQLIVPARSDSEWFVMMTYTKPQVAEDGDPVCPHAEFVQVYLSSFCLDRARFDVEATLLELSNLK